jgi:hypothetical protein
MGNEQSIVIVKFDKRDATGNSTCRLGMYKASRYTSLANYRWKGAELEINIWWSLGDTQLDE